MSQPAPKQDQQVSVRDQQALAANLGRGIYRELPELMDAFNKAREHFNVCFPVMKPDIIPPLHAVALRPVAIDARVDQQGKAVSADIYQDTKTKKYALTKIALDKVAAAANLSWHPGYSGRVDDQSDYLFRTYRACGMVLGLDGTPRAITKHRSIDLRVLAWGTRQRGDKTEKYVVEGGKDATGMSESQWIEARRFIDEQCESKAMNRVVRTYAYIKGLYTAEELKRPFVVAALVFTGETDDPELKKEIARAMVAKATGATTMLFGPAPSAPTEIQDLGTRVAPPPVGMGDVDDSDGDDDPPDAAADGTGKAPELF